MPNRVRINWRRKGGKKPEGVEMVPRPTRWRNPFDWRVYGKPRAVELFRPYAIERMEREPEWLAPLRGLDLACYCQPDEPCHADVLIELANR